MVTKLERHVQRREQILHTALELYFTWILRYFDTRNIQDGRHQFWPDVSLFSSKQHVYEELVGIGCTRMEIDPLAFLQALVSELLATLNHPISAKMFVLMGNAFFYRDISDKVNIMLDERNVVKQSQNVIEQVKN